MENESIICTSCYKPVVTFPPTPPPAPTPLEISTNFLWTQEMFAFQGGMCPCQGCCTWGVRGQCLRWGYGLSGNLCCRSELSPPLWQVEEAEATGLAQVHGTSCVKAVRRALREGQEAKDC